MRAMRYPTDTDVALRLHDTFIKYKGEVFFAKSFGSGNKISLYKNLLTFSECLHVVDANSPEVDITSLEVGFQQYTPLRVICICRGPYRKQKQGICYENLVCRPLGKSDYYFENVDPGKLYSTSFMKMLENDYPSYALAHELLLAQKAPGQVAFNRKLAIARSGDGAKLDLYLNCEVIAQKLPSDTHWFLNTDYNNTTTAVYLQSKGVPLY